MILVRSLCFLWKLQGGCKGAHWLTQRSGLEVGKQGVVWINK